MATPREVGTELLKDFSAKLTRLAQEQLGISEDKARRFANEAIGLMADDWGGQLIYLPKDQIGRLTQRNMKMWKEFTGDNHSELATRYDMSVMRVYQILAQMRLHHTPKQGSLLG